MKTSHERLWTEQADRLRAINMPIEGDRLGTRVLKHGGTILLRKESGARWHVSDRYINAPRIGDSDSSGRLSIII